MANSNVDIANIALTSLGEPAITSLSGTQKSQVLCSNNLEPARQEVLGYHPWSVAVYREELTELEEIDNYTQYDHAYSMPLDVIRILAIRPTESSSLVTAETDFAEGAREESNSYIIEGGIIYTNADSPYVQFIKDLTNPADLPSYLVDAVAANLAKRIAFSLVQNAQIYQVAAQAYNTAMMMALQMDAKSQRNTPSPPDQWENLF